MKTLQKLKRLSDHSWRFHVLFILPMFLLLFISITIIRDNGYYSFNYLRDLKSLLYSQRRAHEAKRTTELRQSRIAVCLVGGARRFELTGQSIIDNILEEYPNSDLFLNSPFDDKAYKFSLLKAAPRIAGIRIFKPEDIPESDAAKRVLTSSNSPNGIQGLLQYFNLVEGCLTMIKSHQQRNNFTYNWIVRTRVDGYWSNPLKPDVFIPGHYVVPSGSSYGGLNDRFGVGDLNTSITALSRLSMIPELDSVGLQELNSESAFKAQLKTRNVSYVTKAIPFCVVSDRTYDFPPGRFGVPVASLSSKGSLSGVKCRPCTSMFSSKWADVVLSGLHRQWSWPESVNGSLKLCDAHGEWEKGWEDIFDGVAGKKLTAVRKSVAGLSFDKCVEDFEYMKNRATKWDVPQTAELCQPGLLQYFNLVEGCLTMIKSHQQQNNFTYDWIVRTRVDGYWSDPLKPDVFIPGHYIVPSGSSYGGLNDRFGVGDLNTSITALSRLSMIPELDSVGLQELNSESAFKAQLKIRNVSFVTKAIPFCVVSDRTYDFPPGRFGVPVASLSSKGSLSGVKCRPCTSMFSSKWADVVLSGLHRQWSWPESVNGSLKLCDAHGEWEKGWEGIFDGVAGKKLTAVRKSVAGLSFDKCVENFEYMKQHATIWDVPQTAELCQPVR